MGCNSSTPLSSKYKVGDRVSVRVERPGVDKISGKPFRKAEVDVGVVSEAINKSHSNYGLKGNSHNARTLWEFTVKFGHGGEMTVGESRLWKPSEADEASAAEIMGRLGAAETADVKCEAAPGV